MARRKSRVGFALNFDFILAVAVFVLGFIALLYIVNIIANYNLTPNHKNRFVSYFNGLPLIRRDQLAIPILMYHYVEVVKDRGDTIRESLDILPSTFDHEISALISNGYTFITPATINEILDGKKSLPQKPVILSFDDGYGDFYTDVLPTLKKYHVKAVAYIISGVLDRPNYMTSDQLREVIKSGLVEIGCHTVNHPNLKFVSDDVARSEITGCVNDLKEEFGVSVVSFAYPYGGYRPGLFPILAAAGLKNATTTELGMMESKNNIYQIPRIRPGGRTGQDLVYFLEKHSFLTSNFLPKKSQTE